MQEEFVIPRSRKARFYPNVVNIQIHTSGINKRLHGYKMPHAYFMVHDNRGYSLYPKKEWNKMASSILKKFSKRNYVKDCYKKSMVIGKKIESYSKKIMESDISNWKDKKLYSSWDKSESLWKEYDSYNVPPWFIGGDLIHKYARELNLDLSDQEFLDASTPNTLPWTTKEEVDRLSAKIGDEKELAGKYYWIPHGYDGPNVWDEKYYSKNIGGNKRRLIEIKLYYSDLKKSQNKIKKKVEDYGLFEDLQLLVAMTDERKRFTFKLYVAMHKVMDEIFRRRNIAHCKGWVTMEESRTLNNKILVNLANKRINGTNILKSVDGRLLSASKKELGSAVKAVSINHGGIKGIVASSGKIVRGKARVLLGTSMIKEMKTGEILITAMTSPEYIPAMHKAAAIVTDEGGLTCHAAIVSRELKKPCIIATHNATKAFKTGDLLEVNTKTGVIKKLS